MKKPVKFCRKNFTGFLVESISFQGNPHRKRHHFALNGASFYIDEANKRVIPHIRIFVTLALYN